MKESKGITLIALIITIIVLLILAGISIATLTGENGVLTKASTAKETTRGRSVEEIKNLWKNEQKLDKYVETSTAQKLEEVLENLQSQNLITEGEKQIIKETGEITIGGIKIEFMTKINFTFSGIETTCFEGTTWGDLLLLVCDNEGNVNESAYDLLHPGIQAFVDSVVNHTMDAQYFSAYDWLESRKPDTLILVRDPEAYEWKLKDEEGNTACFGDTIKSRWNIFYAISLEQVAMN